MKYIEDPLSRDRVKQSILRGIEHYHKYDLQLFAMVLKSTDEVIGCCGFSVEDIEEKTFEFAIHIMTPYQNMGYGYEAGMAALGYIKSYDINMIIAACHTENIKSKNLLLKLGFDYKGDVFFDDTNRFECYFERSK